LLLQIAGVGAQPTARLKPFQNQFKLYPCPANGSGAICEIVNHQGHQGTRRKYLKPKAFVMLRAPDGSGFHGSIVKLHHGPPNTCLAESFLSSVESNV
jgi:hypothetical protein